jgi:hypothetical protein
MVASVHGRQRKPKSRNNVCVGAGGVIRIYGSIKPEPEEIFTAPQHWFNYNFVFFYLGLILVTDSEPNDMKDGIRSRE